MSGEDRRLAIIETAVQLFSERGFEGVTTRELAAAVGVTEPVLYQHFPSKRDLYHAIIEWKMEQSKELREHLLEICGTDSPADVFLRKLGKLMLDWHRADPSFMRLMLRSGLENHELQSLCYERMYAGYFRIITTTLGRLAKAQGLTRAEPATAAYIFIAILHTHCLDRLIFQHPLGDISDETFVETAIDIFLNGLRKDLP